MTITSPTSPTSPTSIGAAAVAAAARALAAATRYDEALALLEATTTDDDRARLELALAMAEVVARSDYVRRSGATGDDTLDLADRLAEETGADGTTRWDLALLRLRRRYAAQLVGPDGRRRFGPEGRDPAVVADLQGEARRLADTAPDEGRRAWALLCLGWIHDNVLGERDAAPACYAEALAVGGHDPLVVFEAQRHLGDHDHDRGDAEGARTRWEESTEAAARAGHLAGALAQQLLLGVLARDAGDESGATLLVTEVRRWSAAVGGVELVRQADGFLAGVDPTRAPTPADR